MRNNDTSYDSWLHYKVTMKDVVMHLILTPSLIIIANYWLLGNSYFSSFPVFITTTVIASFIASILSIINMRSMFRTRKRFPELNQTGKRLSISLLLYATSDFIGCLVILFSYAAIPYMHFVITFEHLAKITVVLLVSATLAGLGYEFFYSFGRWKDSLLENEKLLKMQALTELSVLKSQVNPHFLFNSLNTLSSLITEDPERAESYVNEMTKVYRYLLRYNDVALVTLSTELSFIESYFNLMKTRYGVGIQLETDIVEYHEEFLLPPLTLQLLVENAVKHNTFLKESPLTIKISTTPENELLVSNNRQEKRTQVESTKIGLQNIASKYKLLKESDIQVIQTDTTFLVVLPLIEPNETTDQASLEKDLASITLR
jgi:sensor histidine kinase YesM